MHNRNRFFNNTPRASNRQTKAASGLAGKTFLAATIISVALSACGKTEVPLSTADRVKMVEEKQKSDPNFYLEKKSADVPSGKPAPLAPAVPATVQAEQSKASAKM